MNHKNTIKTTICCALMLNLIVLSVPQIISANIASASVGAANFLPNYFIPGTDTLDETTLSLAVAQYVTTTLANYNSPYGCYYSYEDTCTWSSYCSILSTLKNSYDEAIVFTKGHRGIPCANHISLLDHNGVALPDDAGYSNDTDIFYRTSSDNIVTFVWHCETALNYVYGTIPSDANGYYGMPYCWTHNQYLGKYGISGSQVFLGWTNEVPNSTENPDYEQPLGGSPQYEYEIVPNTYNYANVAGSFWYYMCNGDTVIEALDNLCDDIFNDEFDDTYLNDWLVVWGNKFLELP